MPASTLLASLIAIATLVGSILYVQKNTSSTSSAEVNNLLQELQILRAENQTLKAIQTGDGEIKLPIELYKFVEKNAGLEFKTHVPTIISSLDKLIESAEYRWISQFTQAGIDNRQYAFEILGILPQNAPSYPKEIAIAETDPKQGKIGTYDSLANELLLHKEFDIENIDHQVELIKLLTVALLEQHYPAPKHLTDDTFLARDSIFRGRASMTANRYKNNYDKTAIHKPNANKVDKNTPKQAPQKISALARQLTTFPTQQGKSYLEELSIHNENVFPEIYHTLPQQTRSIYKTKRPKMPTKQPSPPLYQSPNPADRILIDTSLGQAITQSFLNNPELVLKQDQLLFIQNINTPNQPKLIWKTTWKYPQDAEQFVAFLKKNKPALKTTTNEDNPNEVTVTNLQ